MNIFTVTSKFLCTICNHPPTTNSALLISGRAQNKPVYLSFKNWVSTTTNPHELLFLFYLLTFLKIFIITLLKSLATTCDHQSTPNSTTSIKVKIEKYTYTLLLLLPWFLIIVINWSDASPK